MMKNYLVLLLFLLPAFCIAQRGDSLFIREESDGRWMARYRVQSERSVFDVAKKYGVPAAALADANHLSYADRLATGALIKIPLTIANWYNYTPPPSSVVTPLYYRTTQAWEAKDLAKRVGASKRQLQDWNRGTAEHFAPGNVVAVGWISDGSSTRREIPRNTESIPASPPSTVKRLDTIVVGDLPRSVPVLSAIEQAFQDQTVGGTMVTTEKGAAAFFPAGGTIKGVHYAFHNTAPRGSVVRVHNIGTGRTVYAKVLGPLPGTKQYAGAIVGISAAAKDALGVRGDTRAWCEVSYAGY
jgi:hypothetical protein